MTGQIRWPSMAVSRLHRALPYCSGPTDREIAGSATGPWPTLSRNVYSHFANSVRCRNMQRLQNEWTSKAVCDGTCFPCGMFLHCASNATRMSTGKRAWQRMPLLRSPWAKSLSLVGVPAGRLAQGNGRGSGMATQVWLASQLLPF